jgi:hypothetical protein
MEALDLQPFKQQLLIQKEMEVEMLQVELEETVEVLEELVLALAMALEVEELGVEVATLHKEMEKALIKRIMQ